VTSAAIFGDYSQHCLTLVRKLMIIYWNCICSQKFCRT